MPGASSGEEFSHAAECGNFWRGWRPGLQWENTTKPPAVDKELSGVLEMHVNGDMHSFPKCCPWDGPGVEVLALPAMAWLAFL